MAAIKFDQLEKLPSLRTILLVAELRMEVGCCQCVPHGHQASFSAWFRFSELLLLSFVYKPFFALTFPLCYGSPPYLPEAPLHDT